MPKFMQYGLVVAFIVAFNVAWIVGGRMVARRFGFSGPWATYKGQMVIMVPLMHMAWAIVVWSGALSR